MSWFFENDHTRPVFTAEQHIASKGLDKQTCPLPKRAVAFCLGRGLPVLEERFQVETKLEQLPGFITYSPVLTLLGRNNLCFVDGGRGAPQAACTVETLHALGVEDVLVVGLCGVFGEDVQVCDVLIPEKILCEEGASRHYFAEPGLALPDSPFDRDRTAAFLQDRRFSVKRLNTVTTDAPYRQTFFKEALWREKGFAAVDMEASAIVNVCRYYGMKSLVLLMASDRHPLAENAPPWAWGGGDFRECRDNFIAACVELAAEPA